MIGKHKLDGIQFAHFPNAGITYAEVVKQLHGFINYVSVLRPIPEIRQSG